jgi:hypothetical protein
MSAYSQPYPTYGILQQSEYEYSNGQQNIEYEDITKSTLIASAHPVEKEDKVKRKYYTPTELRAPVLIAFCILTLGTFVLLQVAAAAFLGVPGLHSLVVRSAQSDSPPLDCSPGATCSPAPGNWTNPDAEPTPPPPPTAPAPGSWTDPDTDPTTQTSDAVSTSPTPSTAPAPGSWTDPDPEPTPQNPTAPAPGSWTGTKDWQPSYYFVGAYLPTLAAIIFSIWWKCTFVRLKEMQPFYQMARPGGAAAGDSILLAYPAASLPEVLWSSFFSRNWLSFLGAVNMVLITICTLFASETLFISSSGDGCGVIVNTTSDTNNGCHMRLAMRPAVAWALSAVLFAVFILTIIAIVRLRRQDSGILAEATSIAGIASLYSADMVNESSQSLRLRYKRYTLTSSDEKGTNSIVEATSPSFQNPFNGPNLTAATAKKKQDDISMHPAALVTLWLFLAGTLVLILYYRFVSTPGTQNLLEEFMDSESIGVRLFMTVLGLIIKFEWGWIEEYMRRTGPYTALASPRGATAAQSVLVKRPSNPITALFYGDTWRSLLLGVVTLMAVLSEVLVITLTAIPFSTVTAYQAFELSVYISVGILAAMLITVPVVLVWKMGYLYRVEIPPTPECIADVFDLLGDPAGWSSLGLLTSKERDRVVRSWQTRFALRKVGESEWTGPVWRIIVLPFEERIA